MTKTKLLVNMVPVSTGGMNCQRRAEGSLERLCLYSSCVVLCMVHVLEDGKYELCFSTLPADWDFSNSSIQHLFSLTFPRLFSCQSVSPLSSRNDFIHEFQALHHLRFPTQPRLVSLPDFGSYLSSKRTL